MGMDVSGKKPTTKAGEYFRNNCWYWRPLWAYCETVAPLLCAKVKYAGSNDGDGLNARDSVILAGLLELELEKGKTKAYETAYKLQMDSLPDENCEYCHATGKRRDAVAIANPHLLEKCNGCDGKGTKKSTDTWYPFETENVREFIAFLKGCGGFEIW